MYHDFTSATIHEQRHPREATKRRSTEVAPEPEYETAKFSRYSMSKKQFRSQASSGRVGNGFGAFGAAGFGSTQSSPLSYIQEPPDYSGISDANVAVAFKNLSKRDSTTKAKALEDIQATIGSSDDEIEDSILEAWVRLSYTMETAVDSDKCQSGQTFPSPVDRQRSPRASIIAISQWCNLV